MMIRLRSLIFDVFFYVFTSVYLIFFIPFIVISPRSFVFFLFRTWTRICFSMLALIVGLRYTVRGREHLKAATANGPCIIACKHQSAFDTIFISLYLNDVVIILKGQLAYVPFFGYYLKKLGSIFIDRENKTSAIRDLMKKCRDAVASNRSLFIFPEGTRVKPGENVPYQRGISLLYRDLNIPVVPVALNTGVFWGRKSIFKRHGNIVIDIQPAILPGLERDEFMETLKDTIDTASLNLLVNESAFRKKSGVKKVISLVVCLVLCFVFASYFGLKTILDHKMNQLGVKFSTSKIHFGLRALPAYEITGVAVGESIFPGVSVMAESLYIILTGRNRYTIEAKNINAQIVKNVFITIPESEAFLEIRSKKDHVQHIPYINLKNIVINVGSFITILKELQASYTQDLKTLTFTCSTPRSATTEIPILNVKTDITENTDKILTGNVMIQTTFGQLFIEALQQQGLISSDRKNGLLGGLQSIGYEKNQDLKQIIIPVG